MSKIDHILSTSNFELIRSKIASILADELANQKVLNVAALAIEEAKPSPDQLLIDLYTLNIAVIPDKVWEERFIRPQPIDYPMVNVVFTNAPLNEGTSNTVQYGEDKYQIECYTNSRDTEGEKGDVLASIKLHRLLAICREIIMDRNYVQLEYDTAPFIIGYRATQDIVIAQPNFGADSAKNAIYGKLDVLVKAPEFVNDLDGVPLEISYTTMKINDEEKGYYWQVGEEE